MRGFTGERERTRRAMTFGRIGRAWVGLVIAGALVAGCGSDGGVADTGIADTGQDPADVANEAPYGVGAVVGEIYDYSLLVHCGVEWARIDGVWWKTEPLNDGTGNPPPGWENPYTAGTMTLIGEDDARFDGPAGIVEFTRTDLVDNPQPCE